MNHLRYPSPPRANALLPAVIVTAALACSTILFFAFTFKDDPSQDEPAETDMPRPGGVEIVAESEPTPAPEPEPSVPEVSVDDPAPLTVPTPTPEPPEPAIAFRQPDPLAQALSSAMSENRAEQLAALLQPESAPDSDIAPALGEWLGQLHDEGWTFGDPELVGRQGGDFRFTVPLQKPGVDREGTPSIEFLLRRRPDLTWALDHLAIPTPLGGDALAQKLADEIASPPASPDGETPPALVRVPDGNADALLVARRFIDSLLQQDYETARSMIATDRVAAERLAGLCIVFEEGDYRSEAGQLVATAVDGDNAWVVAQVKSDQTNVSTELGIEMERAGTPEGDRQWIISGLNLSKLLDDYTSASGGFPYVPIVDHPTGGESLVLFFEFDEAELHARARRQLEIVARLLKADQTKTIRISGHTDARGTQTYNRRLSVDRADRVRRELLALKVPVEQIKTEAFGPERPLSPNVTPEGEDNPTGRARNRRAEIYLDF